MSFPFPCEKEKPLSTYSTFGIGGPARFFAEIDTIENMSQALRSCHEQNIDFLVIGKGSNCLFDDRGFDGLVILNKIAFCHFEWPHVSVGAGYSFSLLGTQTARKGWSGLEFASGIPGTVGGAVYMNAGANGGETADVLLETTFIHATGDIEVFPKEKLTLSYRFSTFHHLRGAIVSAKFHLVPLEEARQKQLSIIEYRTRTQPYSDKSIGCVFRNPKPLSAGALIESAGLKGKRIGGAEVSTLHANFIVNREGATANDVLELAALIRNTIREKAGVDLEMEIRCIPYQTSRITDVSC